jgi:hypothetical protein
MVSHAGFFLTLVFLVFPGTTLAQMTGGPKGSGGPVAQAGRSNLAEWSIE